MANITATTIPLGSKPYASPFYSLGIEVCQNLYLEVAQSENSKAQYYLLKIPGMRKFGTTDAINKGACRGLYTSAAGATYGVFGNKFYEIDMNGSKTELGTLITSTEQVQMAENGKQLMLVDGSAGYIFDYTTITFTQIRDEYFPGNAEGTLAPTHVAYNDTRFIINVPNTNEYYYSNPYYAYNADNTSKDYDPAVIDGYWNPIQSGRKFAQADNIVGLCCAQNYVWLFGLNTCEVAYDTGNYNGQLYARYDGAIMQIGCSSPRSIVNIANNVYWLGSDRTGIVGVFTNNGMQPQRISKRGLEQIIEEMDTYSDAIGYAYSQAGHTFYVLQFPKGGRTFVYDTVTDSWHERTYLNQATGLVEAHKALYATHNFDKLIVGHSTHSTVFEFDPTYYLNDNPDNELTNYIKCIKTSPISFNNGTLVRYNAVQPIFQQGVGLAKDTVYDNAMEPKCWIAWSDDSGESWSSETDAPMGRMGEYFKRSRVFTSGIGRNRVWRISVTAPVQVILIGIIVESLPCRF